LKKVISKDSEIIDSKYFQKRFPDKGGKNIDLFVQTLFVKFKGSSKYFQIGKSFWYSQGRLAYVSNVDLKKKCLTDTAFSYSDNGKIAEIFIYNSENTIIIPQKIAYSLSSVFSGFHINTPSEYINIGYSCEGYKAYQKTFRYFQLMEGFAIDGLSYTYKSDGAIESAVRYRCNEKVPILNQFNYKNGDIYYSISGNLDSTKSSTEYFLKIKEWYSINFKSKKDTIIIENKEKGKIDYNISQIFNEKFLWDSLANEINFSLRFEISNKSYKCEITNLKRCTEFQCDDLEYYYVDFDKTANHEKLLSDIDVKIKKILENIKLLLTKN
jgi:hypothetical protein